MSDKNADRAVLALLFLPVVLAVSGIIVKFNIVDFIYLILVGMCFLKYLLTAKE